VSVGVSHTGKTSVVCCGTTCQDQESILVMRSFLAKGNYCIRAKVRPLQVDAAATRHDVTVTARSNWNVIHRAEYDIVTTKQPRFEPSGLCAVWKALWEMVYHCRSFKSVQELRSAISRCVHGNNNHRRFRVSWLKYQRIRMAASPWKTSTV